MTSMFKVNLDGSINSMSEKPKTIVGFLHIPKTGGTTIIQEETDEPYMLSNMKDLGHGWIVHKDGIPNPIYEYHDSDRADLKLPILELVKNLKVVCNVRNIFSWLVSYLEHAAGWTERYRNVDHYDYGTAQRGFDYLIKTISDREDIWPNRKFIFFPVFCSNGNIAVDWINRTETLREDLSIMSYHYKVAFDSSLPNQRVGVHRDYREYYTTELIDIVYETWGRELRLYEYEYETPPEQENINPIQSPKCGGLYREITKREKDTIKYHWYSDSFVDVRELKI